MPKLTFFKLVLASVLTLPSMAFAATFTVDTVNDITGDCGVAGQCSLRAAITAANAAAGADTIQFADLSASNCTIDLASNLPTITSEITLNGSCNSEKIGLTMNSGSFTGTKADSYGLKLVSGAQGSSISNVAIQEFGENLYISGVDGASNADLVTISSSFFGVGRDGNTTTFANDGVNSFHENGILIESSNYIKLDGIVSANHATTNTNYRNLYIDSSTQITVDNSKIGTTDDFQGIFATHFNVVVNNSENIILEDSYFNTNSSSSGSAFLYITDGSFDDGPYTIQNNFFGLDNANNLIGSAAYAMYSSTRNLTLTSNYFGSSYADGDLYFASTASGVDNHVITGNYFGIKPNNLKTGVTHSRGLVIGGNNHTITNNYAAGADGANYYIGYGATADHTITGNRACHTSEGSPNPVDSGTSDIGFLFTDDLDAITFSNNIIDGCQQYGIQSAGFTNSTFSNNQIGGLFSPGTSYTDGAYPGLDYGLYLADVGTNEPVTYSGTKTTAVGIAVAEDINGVIADATLQANQTFTKAGHTLQVGDVVNLVGGDDGGDGVACANQNNLNVTAVSDNDFTLNTTAQADCGNDADEITIIGTYKAFIKKTQTAAIFISRAGYAKTQFDTIQVSGNAKAFDLDTVDNVGIKNSLFFNNTANFEYSGGANSSITAPTVNSTAYDSSANTLAVAATGTITDAASEQHCKFEIYLSDTQYDLESQMLLNGGSAYEFDGTLSGTSCHLGADANTTITLDTSAYTAGGTPYYSIIMHQFEGGTIDLTTRETSLIVSSQVTDVTPVTYTVDTLNDITGNCAAANQCSLRAAITAANVNSVSDTIVFDAGLSLGGADTCDILITDTSGDTNINELPQITNPITIDGTVGADMITLCIDPDGGLNNQNSTKHLYLANGSNNSTIRDMRFRGGSTQISILSNNNTVTNTFHFGDSAVSTLVSISGDNNSFTSSFVGVNEAKTAGGTHDTTFSLGGNSNTVSSNLIAGANSTDLSISGTGHTINANKMCSNDAQDTGLTSGVGVVLGGTNVAFTNNIIDGCDGDALEVATGTTTPTITGNQIGGNIAGRIRYGVYARQVGGFTFSGGFIKNTTYGVYVDPLGGIGDVTNVLLSNTTVSNNTNGVYISEGDFNHPNNIGFENLLAFDNTSSQISFESTQINNAIAAPTIDKAEVSADNTTLTVNAQGTISNVSETSCKFEVYVSNTTGHLEHQLQSGGQSQITGTLDGTTCYIGADNATDVVFQLNGVTEDAHVTVLFHQLDAQSKRESSQPATQATTSAVTYVSPVVSFTGAPLANVVADPNNVAANVVFTVPNDNGNAGEKATSFTWNFGDGNSVTQNNTNPANPYTYTHAYTAQGVYTVTLTATNPAGSQEVVRANYVVVLQAPQANFHYSAEYLNATFYNSSTGGGTLSYLWDFGDGATSDSVESQVEHIYNGTGTYTVKLTASNPLGVDHDDTKTLTTVSVVAPQSRGSRGTAGGKGNAQGEAQEKNNEFEQAVVEVPKQEPVPEDVPKEKLEAIINEELNTIEQEPAVQEPAPVADLPASIQPANEPAVEFEQAVVESLESPESEKSDIADSDNPEAEGSETKQDPTTDKTTQTPVGTNQQSALVNRVENAGSGLPDPKIDFEKVQIAFEKATLSTSPVTELELQKASPITQETIQKAVFEIDKQVAVLEDFEKQQASSIVGQLGITQPIKAQGCSDAVQTITGTSSCGIESLAILKNPTQANNSVKLVASANEVFSSKVFVLNGTVDQSVLVENAKVCLVVQGQNRSLGCTLVDKNGNFAFVNAGDLNPGEKDQKAKVMAVYQGEYSDVVSVEIKAQNQIAKPELKSFAGFTDFSKVLEVPYGTPLDLRLEAGALEAVTANFQSVLFSSTAITTSQNTSLSLSPDGAEGFDPDTVHTVAYYAENFTNSELKSEPQFIKFKVVEAPAISPLPIVAVVLIFLLIGVVFLRRKKTA